VEFFSVFFFSSANNLSISKLFQTAKPLKIESGDFVKNDENLKI